jgi:uncharacterized protein YndB with AHSA1/START domain
MASNADRTLVKSPPELWEEIDDPDLMRRWCALLTGRGEHVPVAVTRRDAGERLAWRSADSGPGATVELTLAEKGFGTKVEISAACDWELPGDMLESLLDELGSPQRRPFARA